MSAQKQPADPKASYYDAGGIDTLAIIKAKLTQEQYEGFLLGNALKYLNRVNHKHSVRQDQLRDVEKAGIYIQKLFDEMDASIARLRSAAPS